jgi:hypothetical protein
MRGVVRPTRGDEMTAPVVPKVNLHSLRKPKTTSARSAKARNALEILLRAHETADSLLKAYDLYRRERGKLGGISTDAEQDMLRAMVVMAAAGLDATAKQLVLDAIPILAKRSDKVRKGLEAFVARSIRGGEEVQEGLAGSKFLAKVLTAPSTQDAVLDAYIRDLRGGSLQSPEEVFRVAAALGCDGITLDASRLKTIFDIRNEVVHELDIDLTTKGRKRTHRGLDDMMKHANYLLQLAEDLLGSVDTALASV